MSPILGIWASQNYPRITNSYESIQTVTVGGGGSASISFTSIPSTYKHLQIRAIAKSNRTGDVQATYRFRFNSDSSSAYTYHRLMGDGSSASSSGGGASNYSYLYWGISTSDYSNVFAASIWDVLDYSNTNKNTTVRYLGGVDNNGSGGISLGSGAWLNTSAISRIDLDIDSGFSFTQYSQFALYGIKG